MTNPLQGLQAALTGRYEIERELGRGGMATVYLARDLKHRRPVALKVMSPAVAAAFGADRFLREIELAARLQHPHIVTVFDSGEVDGILWYTMPFVEGETLRTRLEREQRLPLDEAVRIATEAARALEFAHSHGVLHRDVKPENLLLTTDGSTMVADFGIARAWGENSGLTETGMVVGTPAYMSPEQAAGVRDLDGRSDVYSLGCVLYEMLAGEAPYSAPNHLALLAKRLSEPLPSLRTARDIPPVLEQTVARALERLPENRYTSAGELARALQATGGQAHQTLVTRRPAIPRKTWLLTAGAIAAATILAFALRPRAAGDSAQPATAAVLPFADMSERKDQAYFSDGLTDELITALSHVDGIQVAARTSSFQFKGRDVDVRTVGRELKVGSVLEGSVRRSGDHVRITARLVSTRDGYQMWAESYDRDLKDVFAVQEDIARSIISALRVRLGARASQDLRARPTTDLEAYDLYLKGRFAWNQRTSRGMQEAVKYLEQAVGRDSAFALAWAALADAYVLVIPYAGASRDLVWPKARAAAGKALALDSMVGEAHTALAYGTMIYDWDWPVAETSFRRSIAVDPSYPTGRQWYGDFLWSQGRLDEALDQMKEAQRLDPLSLVIGSELGSTYYLMHRYSEAETQLRSVLDLDPNYAHGLYLIGLVYLQQRRYPEAIESLRRSIELGGIQEDLAGALAWAYGVSGNRMSWNRFMAELTDLVKKGRMGPFALALAYTGQGDLTRAFAELNRAIDQRDIFLPEDYFDPLMDRLRADPRFAAIDKRMGIISPPGSRVPGGTARS